MNIQKHFYRYIAISMVAIVLGFGFKIFLADTIEKDILALYFTSIDLFMFALLILVGFRSSMVVSYAKNKNDQQILSVFRIFVIVLMLLAWGGLIPYLRHKMHVDVNYWYLVATVLSMGLYAYISNQIIMYRLYGQVNASKFLEPVLTIGWFLIAFYGAKTPPMQSLFISMIMGQLSLSAYLIVNRYRKAPHPKLSFHIEMDETTKTFVKNSLISSVEFGSGILMMYLAVGLMLHYFGTQDLGDFQVVVKPIFTYMITLFVFPIFRFILPELSKSIHEKDLPNIQKLRMWTYKFSFIVSALFVVFTLFGAQSMVERLFPSEYHGAYLMLVHMSFFFVFVMLNAFQVAFIKASGDFWSALWIRVSGVGILLGTFAVTYQFSQTPVTVVFALVIGYTGMFFISMFKARKHFERMLAEYREAQQSSKRDEVS